MSIDIRENSIIAGDKNGSDFSIASIALFADMVIFITIDELSPIVSFLNRKLDSEKSALNQMHALVKKIPSEAAFSPNVFASHLS